MRVVLAGTVTGGGGVWRHMVDVATGLRARGHQAVLALPEEADGLRDRAAGLGLPVQRLSDGTGADVFHLHLADTYDTVAFRALILARWRHRAVVVTEHLPRTDASDPAVSHSPTPGARSAKGAFKRAEYGLCHRVIAVSEASGRFLETRYGVPQGKLVVIPNGVGPASGPARWPEGPPRFVAIGSVIVQKGFDVLVEAASLAAVPWSVDVLGDGPHRGDLAARADRLGAPVRFLGHQADVAPTVAASFGLVVPSRWEAWPYVAMEAMQQGRAVVASTVDGLPEIVEPGVTGLLVPPGDAPALAGALDRLASDPDGARALGRAGLARVADFGVDRMVDDLVAEYRSVLTPRRRLPDLAEAA